VAKTDKRAAVQPEAVEPIIEQSDIKEVPPEAAWYVIHSYSGYENKVKKNLEHRIESMDMQDKIFQVVVPTEEEIELKDGQRRVVERRVFPGYVLVQMIMDEHSWYVVRNTPNVTGFVGMGNKPTPLPDEEVKRIMRQLESEEPKIKVDFKVGQKVRIVEGAFAEFTGIVQELHADKGRARVMVSFFNRDTPVDVDFLQLEKV
jgi:transcription termination/antitermination protein NusG